MRNYSPPYAKRGKKGGVFRFALDHRGLRSLARFAVFSQFAVFSAGKTFEPALARSNEPDGSRSARKRPRPAQDRQRVRQLQLRPRKRPSSTLNQ